MPRTIDDRLVLYLQKICRSPVLSYDEELSLGRRWRHFGDRQAADRLVTSHMRLVAKVAKGYAGYGFPLSDLISEGTIGLLRALQGFDPERGNRFSSYAVTWVRAAIQEYALHSWSLVKIGTTPAQKRLFFNLRKLKRQLGANELASDLEPEHVKSIAKRLGVPEADVVSMDNRLSAPALSLNVPLNDQDGAPSEWIDQLTQDVPDQETVIGEQAEQAQRRKLLKSAVGSLTSRERDVLVARYFSEKRLTLNEVGGRMSLSRESVRLIEARAINKLEKAVRAIG